MYMCVYIVYACIYYTHTHTHARTYTVIACKSSLTDFKFLFIYIFILLEGVVGRQIGYERRKDFPHRLELESVLV